MASIVRWVWPVAALVIVALLLWLLPQWQTAAWRAFLTPKDLLLVQNELRQTVLLLIVVIGIIAGLRVLSRRVAVSEQAARDAWWLAQEGQRVERYTRAVGQLADERLEVRLGAIYGLEQIAAESATQHAAIVEVLCAYVRAHAAWDEGRVTAPRLPADVQAALAVLGRRRLEHETAGAQRLDLRRTDLRSAELTGMQLDRAILVEAHLDGASMQGVHLAGADLRGTSLSNADLVEADLRGADLREAHLEAAYLVDAHLEGADLGGAFMAGAYLGDAHLEGADLGGAVLDGAYLYKANLDGASLHGAQAMTATGVPREERERINETAAVGFDPVPPRRPRPLHRAPGAAAGAAPVPVPEVAKRRERA